MDALLALLSLRWIRLALACQELHLRREIWEARWIIEKGASLGAQDFAFMV